MMPQLLAHLFGDYLLQSDWMAQNKTKAHLPAFIHALLYSLCFLPLLIAPSPSLDQLFGVKVWTPTFRWLPWLVIFSTHFLVDRYRLARYVVWAKNLLGPKRWFTLLYGDSWRDVREMRDGCLLIIPEGFGAMETFYTPTPPLWACPTGYPPTTPIWLSTFLLIVADNTIHLAINYAALRWL